MKPAAKNTYFIPMKVAMAPPRIGPVMAPICWAENNRPKTRPLVRASVCSARMALMEGNMPEKNRPTAN